MTAEKVDLDNLYQRLGMVFLGDDLVPVIELLQEAAKEDETDKKYNEILKRCLDNKIISEKEYLVMTGALPFED